MDIKQHSTTYSKSRAVVTTVAVFTDDTERNGLEIHCKNLHLVADTHEYTDRFGTDAYVTIVEAKDEFGNRVTIKIFHEE